MQKLLFKLCSILLTMVMVVNMLPMTAWAEEYQQTSSTAADLTVTDASGAQIVEEVIENRTEYSKEFKLDNGLFIAAVYSEPVHFEQNGQWEEIDNTLLTSLDGTFTNTAGVWDVSFPQQLSQGNPVTISKDGYTLSFTMSGELRSQGNLEVASAETEEEEAAYVPPVVVDQTTVDAAALIHTSAIPAGDTLSTATGETTLPSAAEPVLTETVIQEPEATEETTPEPTAEETVPETTVAGETVPEATEEATEPETIPEETIPEEAEPETVPEETEPAIVETVPETTIAEENASAEIIGLDNSPETASVTIDGVAQTFAVSAAQTALGQIQTLDTAGLKETAEHEAFVIEKNASRLLYTNVYSNTNVRYDLQGNQVKESIILESYDSALRGYRYTLNVGDMVPVLYSDGSVAFYDAQQENMVMYMPAPYLVDDNMEFSDDIHVSLTGSGSTYTLTYILPASWLAAEDRAWPVVLDPVVQTEQSYLNIQDRAVVSTGFVAMDGFLYCGYGAACHKHRTYVQYENLPALTSADVIIDANMALYAAQVYSADGIVIGVHKVLDTWQSASLNWSTMPDYDENIQDHALAEGVGWYDWDVTDIVRGWYSGENTGMMFKALDAYEDGSSINWKKFYNSECGVVSLMPTLTITYRNNNGLESYWDYTASSAGRAGTGYVNSYTGNMVWIRSDIGFGGNRMPVSISHVYNLNDSANNDFGMGYGWRTNFNQRVYQWETNSNYYVWEDADGTDHYFYYDSANTYKDEDGLELTLKTNGSGTKKYSVTDKYGNVSYFDTYGRLTYQQNNQATKSTISVYYTTTDGLQIDYITDGAGRKYDFTYSGDLLSKINYYGSGSTVLSYVSFTYSSSKLTKVTDKDGKSSSYTYSGNILLTASDIDGYKLQYTYYTPTETYQPYRVKQVKEYSGTTAGGELNFEYAHNQTTFTDVNGNVQIMQFNNFGNTVSIQDGEGRAQYAQYAINDADDSSGKANQLTLSSKLQNTVSNLFDDSSFERNSLWNVVSETAEGNCSISTADAYHGEKSIFLAASGSTELISGTFTIEPEETIVFSAYIKVTTGSVGMTIYNQNSSYSPTYSKYAYPNNEWQRFEVSYTNNADSVITATARFSASADTSAYIDCVQLERCPTASRYNLVENGDFLHSGYGWSSSTGHTNLPSSAAPQLDPNVYTITGSPSAESHVYQTVQIGGSAGDTFVLSGWAKGDSAPLKDDRQFAIIGTFNYTDGTTKTFTVQFNPDTDSNENWQYSAQVMVAEKAYSSIKVEMAYDYNVNTVHFDGIQLFKEEFGSSYTYDDEGNVTSVKDIQGKITVYEYLNNNLTKELLPDGTVLTYTYDNFHNIRAATSATGVEYFFGVDQYGNNVGVSIGGEIICRATYSSDGNQLVSTTDSAGNVTTYGYNVNTNVLEWVQYPEDTATERTEYTYDTMYRMVTAELTTNTNTALTANYTYSNDQLTAIVTGSTTYSFSYGAFAQCSSIKIGSRTLAEYDYIAEQKEGETDEEYQKRLRNYRLDTLEYGNDDSVQYEYDGEGRIVKQTYEDGSVVSYKYDNNGARATVSDSYTGYTTTYYYDFTSRLVEYQESMFPYTHSVRYTYDERNNLAAVIESLGGTTRTTDYAYDDDNRIVSVTNGENTETYSYDAYGRLDGRVTKSSETVVLEESITYRTTDDGDATTQIESIQIDTSGTVINGNYTYSYDSKGNIISATDALRGTCTTTYEYDSANQLIRENNRLLGKTYTWTYDNAGNIISRNEYAYSTGELGTLKDTVIYTYGDGEWGDLLTSYDGNAITYDTIGNPLTDGTWTYTWEHGRRLESMTDGSVTWQYTYNADGLRTRRTDGNAYYYYFYTDNQLTYMISDKYGFKSMAFTYDADGKPMTVTYDGEVYYYITNLQGDVTAIIDAEGTPLAIYDYNAWGKTTSTMVSLTTLSEQITILNPLRYRGYVYDHETGLYYLQSRYYNPEIGRFINADAFAATGQGILGNNMFAYCGNNPVIRVDISGEFFFTALGAAIGAVTGLIDAALMGTDLGTGALSGAVSGAISGAGVDIGVAVTAATGGAGAGVGVAIAGVFGAVGGVVGTGISSKWEADPLEYVASGLVGGFTNMISFGLAPGAGDIIATSAKSVISSLWNAGVKDIVNNVITGSMIATAATWIARVMNR